MIPTLLGVIVLVFVLFNWVGGDPAYVLAGKISSAEQIANVLTYVRSSWGNAAGPVYGSHVAENRGSPLW